MIDDASTEHFQHFAASLEMATDKYGNDGLSGKDFLALQKKQIDRLISLEKKFRAALVSHRFGESTYKAFVSLICDQKRNILVARPYFRERQPVFTNRISVALKARDIKAMEKFHFNYQFVCFVMGTRKWGKNSDIHKLASEITSVRSEIVEMNLPLAISRARIFYSRTPKAQLSFMDLVQICSEGLMSAIDKFVPPFSKVFRSVIIGRATGYMIENYCLDGHTLLGLCNGTQKQIMDFKPGDSVWGIDKNGATIKTDVLALHDNGAMEGFEVLFDDGHSVICSEKHRFLTKDGMVPIRDIASSNMEVFCEPTAQAGWMDNVLRTDTTEKERKAFSPKNMPSVPFTKEGRGASQIDKVTPEIPEAWRVDVKMQDSIRQKGGASASQEDVLFMSEIDFVVTEEGCDTERRSSIEGERYPDKARGIVLHPGWGDEVRVADSIQSYAPLSDTGSLVLRKIVRVRSVGIRQMYDLEVSHPKHNFLLPNGVVTSNSETLVHFYPSDKRKIYRANKAIHKYSGVVDYDKLAAEVNVDVDAAHRTDASEISALMSAASLISSDIPMADNADGTIQTGTDRFAAPEDSRPDVMVEKNEATSLMKNAIQQLSVFEKKLLSLKGIEV
jgi:DNA-directed RNA polymerase specialized sigma subunit